MDTKKHLNFKLLESLKIDFNFNKDFDNLSLGSLYGCSNSLLISLLSDKFNNICVLADSDINVEKISSEIEFFNTKSRIIKLDDYGTLPYDEYSPPQNLVSDRIASLHNILNKNQKIIITNISTLFSKLPPKDFIKSRLLEIKKNSPLSYQDIRNKLNEFSYFQTQKVIAPGEFAIRGSLIDIFPANRRYPVRIDFYGDSVETIRSFDSENQLTIEMIEEITLLPARDFTLSKEVITKFRDNFRKDIDCNPSESNIYNKITEGNIPAGIEYYLPLFFDNTASLLNYLDKNTLIINIGNHIESIDIIWKLINDRYLESKRLSSEAKLKPQIAFNDPDKIKNTISTFNNVALFDKRIDSSYPLYSNAETLYPITVGDPSISKKIDRYLKSTNLQKILITSSSLGKKEILKKHLIDNNISTIDINSWEDFINTDEGIYTSVSPINDGVALPNLNLMIISSQLLGIEKPQQITRKYKKIKHSPENIIKELTDLRIGSPVIHIEYGIGRYKGLEQIKTDNQNKVITEFLAIEYADHDMLYVPVYNLHLISRYTGTSPDNAPIHKLGSDQWPKAQKRAAKQVRDVAAELLDIYAKRTKVKGISFSIDSNSYHEFSIEFPFQETEDQEKAINDVITDLEKQNPMDRVICGDVGFGKTEVALRAAFIVANAGHQVAILVPTTLLAQQHYRTFIERFKKWPVNIGLLSRFKSIKEIEGTKNDLKKGSVDIIIGTHKLLSDDIDFKSLGLVIIDEEHRFGVNHKEKLKKLRSNIDILSLTATPIPRTLNMTLGGIRDLSIIATPPEERLSIRTIHSEWNELSIKEAITREVHRGGQIYFVHNHIDTIESIFLKLKKILPDLKIQIAHGRMSEKDLEIIMINFYKRDFDLLLCTTIIESGIDIPSANTIIINRADKLGLAQLHQLRGRVGRSTHQAYALLMTPPKIALNDDARKRLEAIESLEELGSGFTLSSHDLEIRGAGELLGKDQSGKIQAIGYSYYNQLLEKAVKSLKDGKEPDLINVQKYTDIEIGLPTLITEKYMPDIHMRLVHYKKIGEAISQKELNEIQIELIDRFGLIPDETKALFSVMSLKLKANTLGIKKIVAREDKAFFSFSEDTIVNPLALIDLVNKKPKSYKIDNQYKLTYTWNKNESSNRINEVDSVLDLLFIK